MILDILSRIELFQNVSQDKFLPHYKMAYELPDIPVRAKLFNYRIDHKKYAAYELSTVELAQE
jgi:hypothetical protein